MRGKNGEDDRWGERENLDNLFFILFLLGTKIVPWIKFTSPPRDRKWFCSFLKKCDSLDPPGGDSCPLDLRKEACSSGTVLCLQARRLSSVRVRDCHTKKGKARLKV